MTDKNSVFDKNMPPFLTTDHTEVAKMSGAELRNRALGQRSNRKSEAKPGAKPGRPKKESGTPFDRFDPSNPRTTMEVKEGVIQAGSVLKVIMPNGELAYIVLKSNTPAESLNLTEQDK